MTGSLESRYVGGLLVMEHSSTEQQLDRELKRLDDRLFLDREFDTSRRVMFYTVKLHLGDRPPLLILDWRDQDDTPRPLSSGVLTEIQRMMGSGTPEEKQKRALEHQAAADERKRQAADAGYRAVTEEWEQYESPVRSGVLHRGVGLRRSRDKQRARGRKV